MQKISPLQISNKDINRSSDQGNSKLSLQKRENANDPAFYMGKKQTEKNESTDAVDRHFRQAIRNVQLTEDKVEFGEGLLPNLNQNYESRDEEIEMSYHIQL